MVDEMHDELPLRAPLGSTFPPPPGPSAHTARCADPRVPGPIRASFTTEAAGEFEDDALTLCATCPARVDCRTYAESLQRPAAVGLWGGRRFAPARTRVRPRSGGRSSAPLPAESSADGHSTERPSVANAVGMVVQRR